MKERKIQRNKQTNKQRERIKEAEKVERGIKERKIQVDMQTNKQIEKQRERIKEAEKLNAELSGYFFFQFNFLGKKVYE